MTIDRTARNYGADLVRWFKDGRLSNYKFEDKWPSRTDDEALWGIGTILWLTYTDTREHTLIGKDALNAKAAADYERCVIFLQSDCEYLWPNSRSTGLGGLWWPLMVLSLGLLQPINIRIQRRNFEAAGDSEVWPFISKADYERALLQFTP